MAEKYIKLVIIIFIIAIFPITNVAISATLSCQEVFSENKHLAIQVLDLDQEEVQYLNRDLKGDLRYPLGRPDKALTKAIDKAIRLSSEEKKSLLNSLNKNSPFSENLINENIKLALVDLQTWESFIKGIVQKVPKNTHHFSVYGFWSHRILELPAQERKKILNLIGKFYNKATSSSDGHYSPKRDLDYLIHACLHGGEQIIDLINSGWSPFKAYDFYLHTQNEALFSVGPTKRGGYTSQAVWLALKAIQMGLSQKDTLLVGGSFTAGRANLMKSDIDYMKDEQLDHTKEKHITGLLREALLQVGIKNSLTLENFPGKIGSPRDRSYHQDLATSNPILFLVKKNEIQMWIYPTKFWKNSDPYEQAMFEPKILILNEI